jgi:hypothetical protein
MLFLIFMIIAAVLFAVAAFGVAVSRINLTAAGLFFTALAFIVSNWPAT